MYEKPLPDQDPNMICGKPVVFETTVENVVVTDNHQYVYGNNR